MPSAPTTPNVSLLEASTQGNEALDALTQATAAALADPALRAELRNEARKKFDGDYDVLFHTFKSRNVGGRSVEARLNDGLQARRAGLAETANSLAADVPNLNFYVFGAEGWKNNSQAPLVAYAPMGVDDLEVQSLKAYDADGNVHWLDAKTDPTQPVVVLGINERTDAMGNVTFGAKRQTTSSKLPELPSYLPPPPCDPVEDPGCDTGGGGTGGSGGTTPTNRQLPAHSEKLVWIKVLDDNEPWFKGNCELMWIFNGAKVPNLPLHRDEVEDAIENIQVDLNITAFYWVPNDMGGFYAVQWLEDDWEGISINLGVSLADKPNWPINNVTTTIPFTSSIKDNDDDMGVCSMHYEEALGTFTLSDIMWRVE